MPDPVDQKRAAAALGVSAKTIQTWQDSPDFPGDIITIVGRRKRYDVDKLRAYSEAMSKKGSDKSEEARQMSLAKQAIDLEMKQQQVEEYRIQLEIKRGQLLSRAAVVEYQRKLLVLLRERLAGFPPEMAQLVPRKQKQVVLAAATRRVDQILLHLSREVEVIDNPKKHRQFLSWVKRSLSLKRK